MQPSPFRQRLLGLLTGLSALASLLCLSLAGLTLVRPDLFEKALQQVTVAEITRRAGERITALGQGELAERAARLQRDYQSQIARVQAQLREEMPRRIAEQVSRMLDLDCSCRQKIQADLEESLRHQARWLTDRTAALEAFIRSGYQRAVARWMADLRIFLVCNGLALGILAGAALARRQHPEHAPQLLPCALLLGLSVVLSAWLYWRQDWLHTLLFGDYLGWTYGAYLLLLYALLWDLVRNRAQITARLLQAFPGGGVSPIC